MTLIVYADFSCPEAYLASRRSDVLRAAGQEVDWRAVQCRTSLPIAGRRAGADDQDEFGDRFTALTELLRSGEQLPWTMPPIIPRTEAAVSAYAEAYCAQVCDDVRRVLFALYWRDGADIGNPSVLRTPLTGPMLRGRSHVSALRESGYAVSVDRGPITTTAYHHIRAWHAEWQQLGSPGGLAVVTDSQALTGLDAVRHLGEQITSIGAQITVDLADPLRYPASAVRPHAGWAAEVGNHWVRTYRLARPRPELR